jgi:hypothetical protein
MTEVAIREFFCHVYVSGHVYISDKKGFLLLFIFSATAYSFLFDYKENTQTIMFRCGQELCGHENSTQPTMSISPEDPAWGASTEAAFFKACSAYLGQVQVTVPMTGEHMHMSSTIQIQDRQLRVHLVDAQEHNLTPGKKQYTLGQLESLSPTKVHVSENMYYYYLSLLLGKAVSNLSQESDQVTNWDNRIAALNPSIVLTQRLQQSHGDLFAPRPSGTLLSYKKQLQKTLVFLVPVDILFNICHYLNFLYAYTKLIGVSETSTTIVAVCNVPNLDNAFFTGNGYMVFGNGDKSFFPLASMDVVGHELGHGVVSRMGGLKYNGHSGALNESLSDVLGSLFEFYMFDLFNKNESQEDDIVGKPDWLMGEDLCMDGKYLRNMETPTLSPQPQPDTFKGPYYMNPDSQIDNGGVHINSGIPNYCFYLLSERMGKKPAFDLVYKCYKGMSPEATFRDYRRLLLQAAGNISTKTMVQDILTQVNLSEESLSEAPPPPPQPRWPPQPPRGPPRRHPRGPPQRSPRWPPRRSPRWPPQQSPQWPPQNPNQRPLPSPPRQWPPRQQPQQWPPQRNPRQWPPRWPSENGFAQQQDEEQYQNEEYDYDYDYYE